MPAHPPLISNPAPTPIPVSPLPAQDPASPILARKVHHGPRGPLTTLAGGWGAVFTLFQLLTYLGGYGASPDTIHPSRDLAITYSLTRHFRHGP